MKKKKHLFLLSQEIIKRFKNEMSEEDLQIISEFVINFKPKIVPLSKEELGNDVEKLARELFGKFNLGFDKSEPNLIFYKVSDDVTLMPERATSGSAGIDLYANFKRLTSLNGYNTVNDPYSVYVEKDFEPDSFQVVIRPGYRVLIPTGVTSSFSSDYVALMYARSGNAFKRGLNLINSVGVIDSDYRNEWFVPIFNNSKTNLIIREGSAIAQVIMTPISKQNPTYASMADFDLFKEQELKNERKGGFGSSDKV